MLICSSAGCVEAENPVRILCAKPEWDKAQARFIRSLCNNGNNVGSYEYDRHHMIFSFGSDISAANSGSPESFVFRQKYLRSYQLTREEEIDNANITVSKKVKNWFGERKKMKILGKCRNKEGIGKMINTTTCRSGVDSCFEFLLSFVVNVDIASAIKTMMFLLYFL